MIEGNSLNELYENAACKLIQEGKEVTVRKTTSKELHPCLLKLYDPTRRTLIFPGRGNNPFTSLFETLWVMAGKDSIEYLEYFLPRAADFSDDKETWRAAYGKRIFNWRNSVDQFKAVYDRMSQRDLQTRQAVISLWDPMEDNIEKSVDFPCSNHLVFLVRDGKLDLTVTIRSNDILWGFSSINVYEFTVMQEIMAGMLGIPVGKYYHFANSFHVYTQGYNAEKNYPRFHASMYDDSGRALGVGKMIAGILDFRDIPPFQFATFETKEVGDTLYQLTMRSWDMLYRYVGMLIDSKPDNVHTRYADIAPRAKRDGCNMEILDYLYLYVLFNKTGGGARFQTAYDKIMGRAELTDLQVSIEYWFQKKQKQCKPDQIKPAIDKCMERNK